MKINIIPTPIVTVWKYDFYVKDRAGAKFHRAWLPVRQSANAVTVQVNGADGRAGIVDEHKLSRRVNGNLHSRDEERRQNENSDERRDILTRYGDGGGYSI